MDWEMAFKSSLSVEVKKIDLSLARASARSLFDNELF
jgi:hypothetical protein